VMPGQVPRNLENRSQSLKRSGKDKPWNSRLTTSISMQAIHLMYASISPHQPHNVIKLEKDNSNL
jgi:hypothetical protein